MKLIPSLIATILLSLSVIQAQQKQCSTSIISAPALRGFKLNMTFSEVKARLINPSFSEADSTGWRYDSFSPDTLVSGEDRKGIELIKLGFVGDQLVEIDVHYGEKYRWADIEKFKQATVENLKLWLIPDDPFGLKKDSASKDKATPTPSEDNSSNLVLNPFGDSASPDESQSLDCDGFSLVFSLTSRKTGILKMKVANIDELRTQYQRRTFRP